MSRASTLGAYALVGAGILGIIGITAGFNEVVRTDIDGASNTIENAGLTPVEVGGFSYFSCSEDDFWQTKFTATNQNGKEVSGVVCEGIFKGSTIRYN